MILMMALEGGVFGDIGVLGLSLSSLGLWSRGCLWIGILKIKAEVVLA
jgi:hypothetical protein